MPWELEKEAFQAGEEHEEFILGLQTSNINVSRILPVFSIVKGNFTIWANLPVWESEVKEVSTEWTAATVASRDIKSCCVPAELT